MALTAGCRACASSVPAVCLSFQPGAAGLKAAANPGNWRADTHISPETGEICDGVGESPFTEAHFV